MKFEELPTVDKAGYELELCNGLIESVSVSNADHGTLTAWLHLKFENGGCGFGGFMLGHAEGNNLTLETKNYAAEFLTRCIYTVIGYGAWEDLEGKPVRVLHEGLGGGVVAIGNFIKDEWFCPRIEFSNEK